MEIPKLFARGGTLLGGWLVVVALGIGCNAILGNERKTLEPEDAGPLDGSGGLDALDALDALADAGDGTSEVAIDAGNDSSVVDATDADMDADVAKEDSGSGDADVDAPSCVDAGGGGPAATLCTGKVVFVSPTGTDDADGCDPCRPKRSIARALADLTTAAAAADSGADAATSPLAGFELRVCAATTPYAEPHLTLEVPVSIRGGWDCKTFHRLAGYGYPTFDPGAATTIDNATPDAQRDTLVVQGAAVDRSVLIEGLRVLAPATGARSSAAILIDASARPTLTDSVFSGRATSSSSGRAFGSAGMLVQGSAAPDVFHCRIEGGTGSGPGVFGSIGVQGVSMADAIFRDDVIDGGSGTGLYGSTGMYLSGSDVISVARSQIDAGSGDGVVTGIFGVSAIDLTSNVIRGSLGTAATISGGVIAVSGTLTRNRIFAGTGSSGANRFGIQISGSPKLANNMIHGGTGGTGIALQAPHSGAVVVFNTLYTSGSGSADLAISATSADAGTEIYGNLFAGGSASTAVSLAACPSEGVVKSFRNNAFVGLASTLNVGGSATTCTFTASAMKDVQDYLVAQCTAPACATFGMSAIENILVQSSCSGKTLCAALPACDGTDGARCLAALFASWNGTADGVPDLLGDPLTSVGWRLKTSAPCAITQGSGDPALLKTIDGNFDILGVKRPSVAASMGAHQQGATTCTTL